MDTSVALHGALAPITDPRPPGSARVGPAAVTGATTSAKPSHQDGHRSARDRSDPDLARTRFNPYADWDSQLDGWIDDPRHFVGERWHYYAALREAQRAAAEQAAPSTSAATDAAAAGVTPATAPTEHRTHGPGGHATTGAHRAEHHAASGHDAHARAVDPAHDHPAAAVYTAPPTTPPSGTGPRYL